MPSFSHLQKAVLLLSNATGPLPSTSKVSVLFVFCISLFNIILLPLFYRECDGSVLERQTLEGEVWGSKPTPPCCILEQDTLLPESTGNTQEAVAMCLHD